MPGNEIGAVAAVSFCLWVYAALGFVMAAIGAVLYNLLAPVVGGIEVDVE
jgi:hypothetical protein